MDWSPEQSRALDAVASWFRAGAQRPFYLAGYAGTGKTTLARHFASTCGARVKFGAFTGKAASVLRAKGCPGATTIHSLIYRPKGSAGGKRIAELESLIEREDVKPTPDGSKLKTWRDELAELKSKERAVFELRDDPEIASCDLVVIDECSMIDRQMGLDLESFGKPILYLGDPGQLPPVGGKAHLSRKPDFLLEEIHRQAADSPIIWLASQVRQGKQTGFGTFGDGLVVIARKKEFDWDLLMTYDQVLCGMNQTRYNLNKSMRKRLGHELLYPVAGDKLICTRNNHEEGLLNGVTCSNVGDSSKMNNVIRLTIDYEGERKALLCDPGHFESNYGKRLSFPRSDAVDHFDYGYAVTGHKAQGSQWDAVAVCDDKMRVNDAEQRRKWLYTVITRAAEKLLIYA